MGIGEVKVDKALRKTMKDADIPRQARQPKAKAPSRRHHDANVDQILGSAAKLFAEKSFGLASIREIAAEANISFPRIYYYLRNKEELLYLIAKRGMLRLFSSYPKLAKDVTDPSEKLRLFIENHVMLSTGNTAETTVAVHETSKLSEPFLSEIRALERQYSQIFRGLLVEIARAHGKELDRHRSRILTSLFFGALNSIPTWYDPARDAGRRPQIAEELYRLFVNFVK
jgi:TetR/AcrR family transcriptional regulator, cholesterol catabolism regulator